MNGKGDRNRIDDKKRFDLNYDKIFKDKCVSCGEPTLYDKHDHVDFRIGYIEGSGQLCLDCYDELYIKPDSNPDN